MGELVIVTGPPGAGKSTVASLVADGFPSSALIQGDWFFGLWRRGAIDPWLPEARPQTAIAATAAAATGLRGSGADRQAPRHPRRREPARCRQADTRQDQRRDLALDRTR